MELIQIIESTVFIFSLGLIVLLVLSYLLFKVKNNTVSLHYQDKNIQDNVSIIYEQPAPNLSKVKPDNNKFSKRFIIINDLTNELVDKREVNKIKGINSRFYIYNPGRNRIIKGLEYSRIKD